MTITLQENGQVVGTYKFLTKLCSEENKKRKENIFSYEYLKSQKFPIKYKTKFLISKL